MCYPTAQQSCVPATAPKTQVTRQQIHKPLKIHAAEEDSAENNSAEENPAEENPAEEIVYKML